MEAADAGGVVGKTSALARQPYVFCGCLAAEYTTPEPL